MQVKEDKIKNAEIRIKNLEKKLSKTCSQPPRVKTGGNSSSDDACSNNLQSYTQPCQSGQQQQHSSNSNNDSTGQSSANLDNNNNNNNNSSIQRTKNFNELELNSVRSRLQERINDLEPLPELLRSTELKLRDALTKLKSCENENHGAKVLIKDLKTELNSLCANNEMLTKKLKESTNFKSSQTPSSSSFNMTRKAHDSIDLKQAEENAKQKIAESLTASKLEPIEKQLRALEEENKELHRQLVVKEDLIRELSVSVVFLTLTKLNCN